MHDIFHIQATSQGIAKKDDLPIQQPAERSGLVPQVQFTKSTMEDSQETSPNIKRLKTNKQIFRVTKSSKRHETYYKTLEMTPRVQAMGFDHSRYSKAYATNHIFICEKVRNPPDLAGGPNPQIQLFNVIPGSKCRPIE